MSKQMVHTGRPRFATSHIVLSFKEEVEDDVRAFGGPVLPLGERLTGLFEDFAPLVAA
jgi:hypothetical protein